MTVRIAGLPGTRGAGWYPRAAVLVAALVAGFGWGAVRDGAAQPGSRVFSAEIGLILNYVRPEADPAFEEIMTRVGQALAASKEPGRRSQAAGWKIYRAEEPIASGGMLYISVLDPVVPGADYWIPQILNEAFPTEVQSLHETYAGTFADGQMILNLTRVDLGLAAGAP